MGRVWHVEEDLCDCKKQLNQLIFTLDREGVIRPSLKPLKNASLDKGDGILTAFQNIYIGKHE